MQPKPLIFYFFLFTLLFLVYSCANPVTPEGGKKDTDPPKIIGCEPANYSTRFKGNSLEIDFDEFINLKNPATEIFISPPLKTPPDARLRGKSMIIDLEDTLAANTTYSITFGNAITDLTEGNIRKGFNYVFSTGDYIDSLSLKGSVHSAFDLKPQKEIFVELYVNNNDTLPIDSLPLHFIPYYVTKTNENGEFIFNNLQKREYKLFAIADQNGDLVFNQPSEKIAFADSLVVPFYIEPPKPDTTTLDSTKTTPGMLSNEGTDSTGIDLKSVDARKTAAEDVKITRQKPVSAARIKSDSTRKADSIGKILDRYPSCPLFLYEETDSIQRLVKSSFTSPGLIMLTFRYPVKSAAINPLYFDATQKWYVEEFTPKKDTMLLWVTRPETDSISLSIQAGESEPDTIMLTMQAKQSVKKGAGGKDSQKSLQISLNSRGGKFNHFKNKLEMIFSVPLISWDLKNILLVEEKDTLKPRLRFSDSLHRRLLVEHKWLEDKRYKLIIPDSVFTGMFQLSHDSTKLDFSTASERELGNFSLAVNIDNEPGRHIIQLINEAETIIYEERFINKSEKIAFLFLQPGKYKIKSILDRNENGRWDTGKYKEKKQPEKVRYFPKTIDVRANWDVEESWD